MHNLALELKAHGYEVTGSDDEIFDPAKTRLEKEGLLPPELGWFPEKIVKDLDGIILGMHARMDNPELARAKELGIQIFSFPEYIYHHSQKKTRVVIAGSHGKTTCTAMLMHVLRECARDFDYLVGSQIAGFERMVRLSNSPLIIIEGDEYLTSALQPVPKFHLYKPQLAMITGVAWDHVNVFPTFENYCVQFRIFLEGMPNGGKCFVFKEDPVLMEFFPEQISYMAYDAPRYESNAEGVSLQMGDKKYQLKIFGRHMMENAAGVANLARELGISGHEFWTALQSFEGSAKRLEKVHDSEELTVFRDFAHAPSKARASVSAVAEQYKDRKFFAVFELHTYSSLREDFLPGYKGSLSKADQAYVLFDPHVYTLKKMPVPEASKIEKTIGDCRAFSDAEKLFDTLKAEMKEAGGKQVVLLMSSGNLGGYDIKAIYGNS